MTSEIRIERLIMQTTSPTPGTISWVCRLMPATIAVGLLLVLGFAQSSLAQLADGPLNFENNFFVTGDYVVAGAYGMNVNMANGFAKGTIQIPDANPGITGAKSVPPGAEILAALLYWQTVEKSTTIPGQPGSGENGFFRPVCGRTADWLSLNRCGPDERKHCVLQ